MSKQSKILLIMGLLTIFFVFYLVFSIKEVTVNTQENISTEKPEVVNVIEQLSQEQIEENYQVNIKLLLKDYENLLGEINALSVFISSSTEEVILKNNDAIEKITNLKIKIMDCTVPEQFRDVHLKFVMSLMSLQDYYKTETEINKEVALTLFDEVKKEYQE